MAITLTSGALVTVLAEAAAAAPREACGLLLGQPACPGTGAHVASASVAANVAADPLTQFEVDPIALIAAHRTARSGGPQLVGYWHSHPNGRDHPSPCDAEAASGDGRIWIIVANGAITCWRDAPDGFQPLPYGVHDG